MINRKSFLIAALLLFVPPIALPAFQQSPKACFRDCKIGSAGLILIKGAEGYSPFIYKDVAGIPTIGFGHALQPGEKMKTPLMGPDALALLERDIVSRTKQMNRVISVPLTSNQFDALTSFTYNLGVETFARSTLLKKVNANQRAAVHPQFLRYDHAGGKTVRGLQVRREAEADLYDADNLAQ